MVGAPANESGAAGRAYVVPPGSLGGGVPRGAEIPIDSVLNVATITGAAGGQLGYAVAIGPVLLPNSEDIIVSERAAQGGAGAVYVLPESSGPGAVSPANAKRLIGSVATEALGEFLVVADVLAGEAGAEVIIGAVGADPDDDQNAPGRVYVVPGVSALIDGADTPVSGGQTRCIEGDSLNDFFGFSIATGDYEDNGLPDRTDLAVGAARRTRPVPPARLPGRSTRRTKRTTGSTPTAMSCATSATVTTTTTAWPMPWTAPAEPTR